jgi:hypothetical protein
MTLSDQAAALLETLADELAPIEWLHDQVEQLSEEDFERRLGWLQRQAKAGISQRLVAFLGPDALVLISDHQILVRQYVGVHVRHV